MTLPEPNRVISALRDPALKEQLAAAEHQRWAHWQSYMHEHGQRNPDGSLTLPADLVRQWDGQIERTYNELSDSEKNSDREQVDRYLPLIEAAVRTP